MLHLVIVDTSISIASFGDVNKARLGTIVSLAFMKKCDRSESKLFSILPQKISLLLVKTNLESDVLSKIILRSV